MICCCPTGYSNHTLKHVRSFVVYQAMHTKNNVNNTASNPINTPYNSINYTYTDMHRNCFNDHDQSALRNIDPDINYECK